MKSVGYNRLWGELFIWVNIVLLIAQVVVYKFVPGIVVFSEQHIIAVFSLLVTLLGFVIAVLAICFTLLGNGKKEEVEQDNSERGAMFRQSKLWFIDCFRLIMIDVIIALLCLLSRDLASVCIFIFLHALIQMFFIFHYYFREIFKPKNKEKGREEVINHENATSKKWCKALRTVSLFIPFAGIAIIMFPMAILHVEFGLLNHVVINFGIVIGAIVFSLVWQECVFDKGEKHKEGNEDANTNPS